MSQTTKKSIGNQSDDIKSHEDKYSTGRGTGKTEHDHSLKKVGQGRPL